jgi:hypothetical protein
VRVDRAIEEKLDAKAIDCGYDQGRQRLRIDRVFELAPVLSLSNEI